MRQKQADVLEMRIQECNLGETSSVYCCACGAHSFSSNFLPSGSGSSSCPVRALICLVAMLVEFPSMCYTE